MSDGGNASLASQACSAFVHRVLVLLVHGVLNFGMKS